MGLGRCAVGPRERVLVLRGADSRLRGLILEVNIVLDISAYPTEPSEDDWAFVFSGRNTVTSLRGQPGMPWRVAEVRSSMGRRHGGSYSSRAMAGGAYGRSRCRKMTST